MRVTVIIVLGSLVVAMVVSVVADARFQSQSDALIRRLLQRVPRDVGELVRASELAPLPSAVRRWLEASGVIGKPRVRCVRLRQRGQLRTAPEQAFMPARAEQYFSVEPPAFIWRVKVPMWRVLPIAGRDSFVDGKGRMLIEAAALIPVVDAAGLEIDQGTLLRFLGEMVWFPSAALSPYLHWEPIDADSARATMSYRGVIGSAVFHFDAFGRMTEMHAERYMQSGSTAHLTPWRVSASEWRQFHGVQVPSKGSVGWELATGEFTYYRWQILDIDYDLPALYER